MTDSKPLRIGICILVALSLHLALGWEWSLLAGVFCGLFIRIKAWLWGAVSTSVAWSILIVYNLIQAREPVLDMLSTMGQILGNLPGALIVLLSVLTGGLLGLIGGEIGTRLVKLIPALKLYREPPGVLRA